VIVRRLIFEDAEQSFRVMIADEAAKHMFRLCNANRSQETGGILTGSYSSDYSTAEVVEATGPPADSEFGRDWFHRGTDGLQELLIAKWNEAPRTHYLGEWHFHTANVPWPSAQDKKQMREVARDARYKCAQPLLVIVCPVGAGQWVVKCYVFPGGTAPQPLRMVEDPDFDEPEPGEGAA
jgi:hypothetical protein